MEHLALVMRIARAGFEGEKQIVVDYTRFLADKLEASGDKTGADHLRSSVDGKPKRMIYLASAAVEE